MKNKVSLLLLAVVLLFVTGWTALAAGQKSNSARQSWEYRIIITQRSFAAAADPNYPAIHYATAWNSWSEDDKALPTPVDMGGKLHELGAQGWELVAVAPRASISGQYSGSTTENEWVFKRPKP